MTLYIGGLLEQTGKIHYTCTFPTKEECEKWIELQVGIAREGRRKVQTFLAPLQAR